MLPETLVLRIKVKKKISFTKMLDVSSFEHANNIPKHIIKHEKPRTKTKESNEEKRESTANGKEDKKEKREREKKKKIVLFRLQTEYYGIDISEIDEIIETEIKGKIAGMPNFTVGVFDIRNEGVPVISLFKQFHLEEREVREKETVLLLRRGKKSYGILIDELKEVIDVAASKVFVVPKIFPQDELAYLTGMTEVNSEIVALVNIWKVLENFNVGL